MLLIKWKNCYGKQCKSDHRLNHLSLELHLEEIWLSQLKITEKIYIFTAVYKKIAQNIAFTTFSAVHFPTSLTQYFLTDIQ